MNETLLPSNTTSRTAQVSFEQAIATVSRDIESAIESGKVSEVRITSLLFSFYLFHFIHLEISG
jgi:hypothetical protein